MKQADLKKKLSERLPLLREAIKPVNLYEVAEKEVKEVESHNRTSAQSHSLLFRVNRGYKLREDVIRNMKSLAVKNGKKLYEVMEEAMTEYLKKYS